jgi:hypothetical protein
VYPLYMSALLLITMDIHIYRIKYRGLCSGGVSPFGTKALLKFKIFTVHISSPLNKSSKKGNYSLCRQTLPLGRVYSTPMKKLYPWIKFLHFVSNEVTIRFFSLLFKMSCNYTLKNQ